MQSHLASLERRHAQPDQLSGYWIQTWQVEQPKIMPKLIMAADALIVVHQIPTAVQDQLSTVDLDRPRMVRGMPMNQMNPSVDQAVCKVGVFGCNVVTPVATPVN